MLRRALELADPRPRLERGLLFWGLWILAASVALLVLSTAPLLVAIMALPADANPVGLGLLAFAGTGLASLGLALGAVTSLVGLVLHVGRERQ